MARTLVRFIMAAVLITAYLPMPTPLAKHGGHAEPMACCAPKACCDATHACSSGGGCGGAAGAGGGAGPRLLAGGCGDPTPTVTPLQLDPTMTPQVAASIPVTSAIATLSANNTRCSSHAAPPLVPPPRA